MLGVRQKMSRCSIEHQRILQFSHLDRCGHLADERTLRIGKDTGGKRTATVIECRTYRLHLEDILDECHIRLGRTGMDRRTFVGSDSDRTDRLDTSDGATYTLNAESVLDLLQRRIVDLGIDDSTEVVDKDVVACGI